MTLNDAMKAGLKRVRLTHWAPRNYLRLNRLPDGLYGPWGHLYAYAGVGVQMPQAVLLLVVKPEIGWEAYSGPLDDAELAVTGDRSPHPQGAEIT